MDQTDPRIQQFLADAQQTSSPSMIRKLVAAVEHESSVEDALSAAQDLLDHPDNEGHKFA